MSRPRPSRPLLGYRSAMRRSRTAAALAVAVSTTLLGLALPASAQPLQPRAWYGLPTTMTLSTPQVYDDVPVTFTATLSNTVVTGTVTFWVNDPVYGLGPSVRVANGKASLTFTPGYTWVGNWQTYGASFSPDPQQGTTSAEAASQPMSVLPNKGADPITVNPPAITVTAGTATTLTAGTASGSALAFAASGTCTVTATGAGTATVSGTTPGTCAVTATSNGAGPYLGNVATVVVQVTAPAKPPQKPKKPSAKKPGKRTQR